MTKLQFGDLAVADLANNGGKLQPEEADRFIQQLRDSPTVLRRSRIVPMTADTMKINKIGFGSRILKPAPGGSPPYAADDGTNDRYLAATSRSDPTTSQISMVTKELMAEVHITDDVMENNIELANFRQTLMTLIADRVAEDLEELVLLGDTASGDAYLAQLDGVLKRLVTNVVDAGNAPISASIFNSAIKAIPTRYRRNMGEMVFYSSMDRQLDYRLVLSGRGTPLGDAVIQGGNDVPVLGVPLVGAALMPNANLVFTNPRNIIVGFQRDIRMEAERDIRARSTMFVVTCKIAVQIEETAAASKVINLG